MHFQPTLLAFAGVLALTSSYELPDNLREIYNKYKPGECKQKAASGFGDGHEDNNSVSYCEDIPHALYLHSYLDGGRYADMDIDCDGANRLAGRCSNDPTGQDQTAFQYQVQQYGIEDLDATIHPYIVFGNEGAHPSFHPQSKGMKPLSVMAVVCNDQLFYGVWGDTNGGTFTGEASLAMADLCFPDMNLNGDNGYTPHDVLYIGFEGDDAVPGESADWKAQDTNAFEASIKELGDKLVAGLSSSGVTSNSTGSGSGLSPTAGSSNDNGNSSNSSVSTSTVGDSAAAATGVPVVAAGFCAMAMIAKTGL